jgi:hypothetical protein
MAALLLLPPLFFAAMHIGARIYCGRIIQRDEADRLLLARLPEMEAALTVARAALRPFHAENPIEAGRSEEFSRWIMETARNESVDIKGLTVTPVNDPASLTPALTADFRCDDEFADIVRFVHTLQDRDARIVLLESLQLNLIGAQIPHRYSLSIRMRSHLVAALPQ